MPLSQARPEQTQQSAESLVSLDPGYVGILRVDQKLTGMPLHWGLPLELHCQRY
jgi:hypothetical protein